MTNNLGDLVTNIAKHPLVIRLSEHVTNISGCSLQLMQPLGDDKHEFTLIGEAKNFEPCQVVCENREGLKQCWADCDAGWKGPVPNQIKVFTCHAGLTEVLIPVPINDELIYLTSRGGLCLDSNKPSTAHLSGIDQGRFQNELKAVPKVSRKELDDILELMKELVSLVAQYRGLENMLNNMAGPTAESSKQKLEFGDRTYAQLEAEFFLQALAKCDGNRLKAAKLIDVPKSTFYRRIDQLGLSSN